MLVCEPSPRIGAFVRKNKVRQHGARATMLQVVGNRLADRGWHRQLPTVAAFACHRKAATLPIDATQGDRHDFAGAKSQAREQNQYRVIPPP